MTAMATTNDAVMSYRKKLEAASRSKVQTETRTRALRELEYRLAMLERAPDIIEQARVKPSLANQLAVRYVTDMLDGRLEGYESEKDLYQAFLQAQAAYPDAWNCVISAMNEVKGESQYPDKDSFIADIEAFISAVMQFFILEREALFPLSKEGGKKNEQN